MTRIVLEDIEAGRPVKITIEIPAQLQSELVAYGVVLNDGRSEGAPTPEQIAPLMIRKFIASDRQFARRRKSLAGS